MASFYSIDELKSIGLKSFGNDVLISRKTSIYSPELITIGNNVRIDDFCILSGKITIGSNIHISAFCALYGAYGIEMEDYSGMSPRSTIFSATDDFSGEFLIGPIHPAELINIKGNKVTLKKYTQLGANTVVMPGVVVEEGAVTGAMSFVNENLSAWTINAGIPAKCIKNRSKNLLNKLY